MVFKKRQPKGSPKGGQFAPDMRGKEVPVVEPLPSSPTQPTEMNLFFNQKAIYAKGTGAELTRLYMKEGVPSRIFLSSGDPEPAPGSVVYDPVRDQMYYRDTQASDNGVYYWRGAASPYPRTWEYVTDEYAVLYLLDGQTGEAPQNALARRRIKDVTQAALLLQEAVRHLEDQQAMPDDSYLRQYVEPAQQLLNGEVEGTVDTVG